MEFTIKKLEELLGIASNNIAKALKDTDYELKEVQGSAKKVKHYKLKDLPQRYQDKLKEQGIEVEEKPTHISQAKFTNVYLLASPEKQKIAVLKCKLIEFYMKRDSSLNTEKWLSQTLKNLLEFDELGSVSLKQLYDWYKKYREAKAKGLNVVEAFIDTRGAKRGVKALSDEQKTVAERYFVKTSRPMMSEVHRNMCHTFGDTMPSYDVLNSYYKEWQIREPLLYAFSKSPDQAKNSFLVAYGNESEKAKYKNQYWELDSTPADVMCADGKRYAVLAAIDVYTRRVVFHVAETSSGYTISQLLRKAIIKLGIPENVVIDNGKDYTSKHFESVCLNLGINMIIVPPFSGECKPHVERVFGTMSRQLFEQIPGYIGHNVAQRSELQARQSFAHKIASQEKWREERKLLSDEEREVWRDAWKIKKENIGLKLTLLLDADELQSRCDGWVDKIYEQTVHRGIKSTPIDKWNKNTSPVESIPDIRMLDLLLGESFTRKVGKKGVSFDGCNYAHLELVEYIGHYVHVMVPDDMSKVLVYNLKMELVCIAEDLEHIGESRFLARKAKKKSQSLMRQMDKIVKEAESIKDTSILDRIDDACDIVESKTFAVTKHTEAIDRVMRTGVELEARDKKALEDSNHYDFTKEDDEGLPVKVLENGRPEFKGFVERFIWVLENDEWNEKDEKLKEKNPEIYEFAYAEYMKRKAG
ncbi:DDE-type integrase/transposase/recombinase [Sulfurimonas sp.]